MKKFRRSEIISLNMYTDREDNLTQLPQTKFTVLLFELVNISFHSIFILGLSNHKKILSR